MNTFVKILVTVGVVFLFFFLFGLLVGGRQATGHQTPGGLGIVFLIALFFGVRAIWKKQ